MKIRNFGGGLNTFDSPINIGDNQCASLENVCFEEGNIIRSRHGFSLSRSATNVTGLYNWYKGATLHQIYTTNEGLWDGPTNVHASFTGPFKAAEYGDLLYLVNGSYNKRYNGATLFNWGMNAPGAPTVSASAKSYIVIDDFESLLAKYDNILTWGSAGSAKATEASRVAEGSESLRFILGKASAIVANRTYTAASALNLRDFGGVAGGDDDYIQMKVLIKTPTDLRHMRIKLWDHSSSPLNTVFDSGAIAVDGRYTSNLANKYEVATSTEEQLQRVYLPSQEGAFAEVIIPKSDFDDGGNSGDWSDIRRVQWHFVSKDNIDNGPVDICIDDMKVGGGPGDNTGLYGKFRCVAGYYSSIRDEYFGISAESDEVELDIQGLKVSGVSATYDDQADQYIVWARKTGSIQSETTLDAWTKWYKLTTMNRGATQSISSVNNIDLLLQDELTAVTNIYPANVFEGVSAYTRLGSNNLPPPVATNICIHRGKCFFAVGSKIYHSKPLAPYAVPAGHYIIATSDADPIQAFYSDGMDLTVFSKISDYSYLMAGEYDARNMYSGTLVEARDYKRGCIAPYSVVDGIYASSQGLCYWDGQQGQILTGVIKPTYRAISDKTSLVGVVWEDMYFLANPSGNSIVCERYITQGGVDVRFYVWSLKSTISCCAVDRITNRLYVGTNTGIYYYNRSAYNDVEGNFRMLARLKEFEYAPEDQDAPFERYTIHSNCGGNSVSTQLIIDDVVHASATLSTSSRQETEAFTDIGSIGSYMQPRFVSTVSASSPVRIYGIEIT